MKWKMKENLVIRRKATSNVNYVPGGLLNTLHIFSHLILTVIIDFILEMKTLKLKS